MLTIFEELVSVAICSRSNLRSTGLIACIMCIVICDQASLYLRGGKVRLIQLLDYLSVASPESGLFSDWSRNKRYLELSH